MTGATSRASLSLGSEVHHMGTCLKRQIRVQCMALGLARFRIMGREAAIRIRICCGLQETDS